MDLLDIPLPELSLRVDIDPSTFFDRCEAIAGRKSWRVDRRRAYAAPGYDQLNLHLGNAGPNQYPMIRMVSVPRDPRRLDLDVVAHWASWAISYHEYLQVARTSYSILLGEYKRDHGKRFRLGVPKRPESLDLCKVDCGRISYAAKKFGGLTRSLAIAEGDARRRLISAFSAFHVKFAPTTFHNPYAGI